MRWSGGVKSTSSALRLPLLFTGVSRPDFSDTERRPGSLAVRGVRGTRSDVGGGGVVIEGKAAEDGPAPPLWCFEEDEAEVLDEYPQQNDSEEQHFPQNITVSFIVLQNGNKMKVRNRQAVVRMPYLKLNDNPEVYYYSLLLQYMPF